MAEDGDTMTTTTATLKLKPGLKLPQKPGSPAGLKLPPKPGTTASALRPGLKLPTQPALKPGVRLPPKPVIRKPGEAAPASSLPKPVAPVAVDAQGVGKLPTVSATAVQRGEAAPDVSAVPKPMEALKSVTQKLKGITQEIPQQAILRKTGIIAEGGESAAQKEAAKHKTARISLSDAMGVAPVKSEAAPMKTIRIKRPIDIPGATASLTPPARPASGAAAQTAAPAAAAAEGAADKPDASTATVTQRKTLKIARPGGAAVRPGGKFGVKRPSTQANESGDASVAEADGVADIPDIPNVSAIPTPVASASDDEGSGWVCTLSTIVQVAACVAIGTLVWFFYENSQLPTYCGGLGWGQ